MMRTATLNTRGQREKWEARRPVFRTDFGALDANIVALQETITDDTD
jgi:mRNA deadenylase 3'-5' endonuclease subunit Ccr4